ncbi:MAG TPA: tyrosine-type recombinase/integrase [Casimicrobiaceae bacterium]|nr:tyrosine-type recombinase/integrase [Casimicrobiaceae bacterium]
MRRTRQPETSPPALAPVNVAHLAVFEAALATRPLHTRSAYLRDAHALAALAGEHDMARLGTRELRRYLATLHGRGLSGRSLARTLSSWRAFYRVLQDRDSGMSENPCAGIKAPKAPKRLPAALSPDEAVRLVEIRGDDPLTMRDRALFELAYSSGLRLAELAGLDVERVDLATGEVRVWGKGAKERIVPVGAAAAIALRAWLPVRGGVTNPAEKALFVGKGGKRISPRSIERRLAAWAVAQGLGRHVHPHMLRHSFASHVLQSSGDLRAVQEMLGHASIASTQVYTHLDFQYLAKAYDAAHPRARKKSR